MMKVGHEVVITVVISKMMAAKAWGCQRIFYVNNRFSWIYIQRNMEMACSSKNFKYTVEIDNHGDLNA